MASRIRQELEGAVGFFANTLVLRSVLSPDISFREALRRVRAATLGAYRHADISFSQVVATVQPERSNAANPLFQVMCAFQNVPNALLEIESIEVRQINSSSGTRSSICCSSSRSVRVTLPRHWNTAPTSSIKRRLLAGSSDCRR